MKIFKNTNISNQYKKSVIAIGNFDAIHKGHQRVLKQANQFAKKNKIKFGILTFSPLPVMFFKKKIKNFRIISENQKIKLLKKYKADFVINIKFNKNFSKIKAERFLKEIIFKKINPRFILVSNNFRFGNKREGNLKLLEKFSKKYNYSLVVTNAFKRKGKMVSSTLIRKSLQNGNFKLASTLLSRTWHIEGIVEGGKKIGRSLGYPTCNIHVRNYILPKIGIYAVKVLISNSNKILNGIAYFGSRPTFGGKFFFLEVNIFGIKKNLYKKKLKVYFLKFLRKDKKFKNSVQLIKQMNKDVTFAKKCLKTKLVL